MVALMLLDPVITGCAAERPIENSQSTLSQLQQSQANKTAEQGKSSGASVGKSTSDTSEVDGWSRGTQSRASSINRPWH